MATHSNSVVDKDTGYAAPGHIQFTWESEQTHGKGKVHAEVEAPQGIVLAEGGLMEKVDVLAEIPYVIRKALAAVTGTKPYIYQVSAPPRYMCRVRSADASSNSTSTRQRSTSRSTARTMSQSKAGSLTKPRSSRCSRIPIPILRSRF